MMTSMVDELLGMGILNPLERGRWGVKMMEPIVVANSHIQITNTHFFFTQITNTKTHSIWGGTSRKTSQLLIHSFMDFKKLPLQGNGEGFCK